MKFIYKYDDMSEIHEIIAMPEKEYNNKFFEDVEINVYDEFVEKFPDEGFLINSPQERIIENGSIIYEKQGESYLE
jgi:hypothetical protein